MKKLFRTIICLTLICLLAAGCTGCDSQRTASFFSPQNTTRLPDAYPFASVTLLSAPRLFPKHCTLCGVEIGNKNVEDAKAAIEAVMQNYSLSVTLNGNQSNFTSAQLSLSVSASGLAAWLNALLSDTADTDPASYSIIKYDEETLWKSLESIPGAESSARSAYLSYDSSSGRFVLNKETSGYGIDLQPLFDAAVQAIQTLQPSVSKDLEKTTITPRITADSQTAKDALQKANNLLGLQLQYVYAPSDGSKATETISGSLLASLLSVGSDGLSITVNPSALESYVAEMKAAHSLPGPKSMFKTTGGGTLDLGSSFATGEFVDSDKLYNDIASCIANSTSGTRTVSYIIISEDDLTANFGGNYVEVNLSAQHMWVYRNGTCVVSSDLVSGNVSTGNRTPTGLYYVSEKDTDSYLVGPTWNSFVNYWIAFNGAIGLHDADGWRSSYGGSIYLYNGSHGCVNLPYWAAASTYENVSIGTPVVVYGGATTTDPIVISGTKSYTVTNGCSPFTLDAAPDHQANLIYSSDNAAVATVNSSGKVTITGSGVAHITVKTEDGPCTSLVVTITVQKSACEQGKHTWNSGTVTTAPTCTASGWKTYTCTVCGKTTTETVPATGHSWNSGTVITEADCTHDGSREYTCNTCGATKTETIPATGHSWDSGVVTIPPTCEGEGTIVYTCTVCGETRPESLPANGHQYGDDGICTECGASRP